MRSILYTSLVLVTICLGEVLANKPDELLHKNCLYPTVKLSPIGQNTYGTGTIVKSVKIAEDKYYNIFLTCAHIADSTSLYNVKVYEYVDWSTVKSSSAYRGNFYGRDFGRDLAVGVFISAKEMPVADLDLATTMYVGTDVFHIGCGMGDEPRLDFGKITSVKSNFPIHNNFLMRTSVQTVPGDSGGPLFYNNKVIGIAKSIRIWRDNYIFGISYYVPIERLVEWSKENQEALHFMWTNKELPKTPFWLLNFLNDYEVTLEDI